MAYVKDRAIALRKLDYSESSQVLVLYTAQHGQQRLIAKGIKRGAKKRFAVGIDLLELGEAVFSRRAPGAASLGVLTEWHQINLFTALRANLKRLYAAQYLAEITSLLTAEDDPHPAVFDHLAAALEDLCASDRPLGAVVGFQKAFLTEIGLMPMLYACVCCGRPAAPTSHEHFSSIEGGLLCRDCEPHRVEKRQVSRRAVEALRQEAPVPKHVEASAFDLLDYHITHLTGHPPRLSRHLVPVADRRTVV